MWQTLPNISKLPSPPVRQESFTSIADEWLKLLPQMRYVHSCSWCRSKDSVFKSGCCSQCGGPKEDMQ